MLSLLPASVLCLLQFSILSSTICVSSLYLSLLCRNKSCRCSVVIATSLRLSYSLCLSNIICRCSAVSLSRRRLYCSLLYINLSSTPSIVPINHHQHILSVIYNVINFIMWWSIVPTIFGVSVIYSIIYHEIWSIVPTIFGVSVLYSVIYRVMVDCTNHICRLDVYYQPYLECQYSTA